MFAFYPQMDEYFYNQISKSAWRCRHGKHSASFSYVESMQDNIITDRFLLEEGIWERGIIRRTNSFQESGRFCCSRVSARD
jgi:hypothetical protein